MANTVVKWTKSDEEALQKLQQRKDGVMAEYRANLARIMNSVAAPAMTEEQRVAAAIQWADDLRDALLPFDSGTRAAQEFVSKGDGRVEFETTT